MAKKKVIIIGAGPAGLMAAIVAARQGAKVTVLEKNQKIGRKLLATGNGRCNISNQRLATSPVTTYYLAKNQSLLETVYQQMPLATTKAFFKSIGLILTELEEGKLYPHSLEARSVVNALTSAARQQGVIILTNTVVTAIEYHKKFIIHYRLADELATQEATSQLRTVKEIQSEAFGKLYATDCVLATGGLAYPSLGSTGDGYTWARQFGHHLIKCQPSIVQLEVVEPLLFFVKRLQGVKLMGRASLMTDFELPDSLLGTKPNGGNLSRFNWATLGQTVRQENGEILFTDYGLSGPPILQLSRQATGLLANNKPVAVVCDFWPNMTEDELDNELRQLTEQVPHQPVGDLLAGLLPQKLSRMIVRLIELPEGFQSANLSRKNRRQIIRLIKALPFIIEKTHGFKHAQVTAGGVSTDQIKPDSLESKLIPRLYFAGEILDIDGDCGGYNLQWAWSSGAIVGQQMG